ncbi:MAG: 4-(cytidine 5'-diphospho)-2-C-methyl-D-erythritol kinase [Ruthenibacterium sp.]
MYSVTVLAPAKLYLTLDITGIAENGYHQMDMLMQTVSLYERVILRKSRRLRLTLPGSKVPAGPHNTATKAALAFFHETGLLAGVDIIVHKAVPVRAGMAGGSADAAAVLVGLNALYNAHLSVQTLCRLGAGIGADVPFAVLGGTARATGIGEVMQPLAACPPCWFTVCMPAYGVSTPQAFARYDSVGTNLHPDTAAAAAAVQSGDLYALCTAMGNALQFSSESAHNAPICAMLRKCGALSALMTGSGAAVFGVFDSEKKAKIAKEALRPRYPECWVVQPVGRGAQVIG